jgi:hypothetical protein
MIKNIEKKIEFFMTEAKRRDFIVTRNPWAIKVEKKDSFIFCMISYDIIDGCKTYTQLRYLLNDTEHEIAMVFLRDKGVYIPGAKLK